MALSLSANCQGLAGARKIFGQSQNRSGTDTGGLGNNFRWETVNYLLDNARITPWCIHQQNFGYKACL